MAVPGKEVNFEVASEGQTFTKNVNVKKVIEQDIVPVTFASTTATVAKMTKLIQRCSFMELWIGALGENLASGSTLTVKFYKTINGTQFDGETVTVDVPAVTANTCKVVEIVPILAELESYDRYSIEGSVTIVAGGTIELLVGKKTQG